MIGVTTAPSCPGEVCCGPASQCADGFAGDDGASPDGAGSDTGVSDSSTGGDGAPLSCPIACNPASSFCELSYGPPDADGGSTATPSCVPFQSPCDAAADTCACATVGPFCTCAIVAGQVTVTCPFHP